MRYIGLYSCKYMKFTIYMAHMWASRVLDEEKQPSAILLVKPQQQPETKVHLNAFFFIEFPGGGGGKKAA